MTRSVAPDDDPTVVADAHRTLPRGASREDTSTAPAVDPATWALHVRYQHHRRPEDLAALVEEYRPYALALARRLHREGEPLDDLRQVALEALVASLQRFDCERATPFAGFATPTILGALKRHYRDQGWALRVPRSVHQMAGPAREAADRLAGAQGRQPTVAEIATELGVDPQLVLLAQTATRARRLVSLDAPPPASEDDRGVELGVEDSGFALAEGRVALEAALVELSPRDRTVLGLSFFEGLTQVQIAERFGVSQMQVSRWITSSLKRLRSHMEASTQERVSA